MPAGETKELDRLALKEGARLLGGGCRQGGCLACSRNGLALACGLQRDLRSLNYRVSANVRELSRCRTD